ncbi:MAG: nitroreductase family protein [Nitrososphaeraceae archaeon]
MIITVLLRILTVLHINTVKTAPLFERNYRLCGSHERIATNTVHGSERSIRGRIWTCFIILYSTNNGGLLLTGDSIITWKNIVKDASVLIVVCSNTSRSVHRFGKRGTEFYSVIDGAFASMIILLSAVNEGIGASFVGAFEDDKVTKILRLPLHVKPIGIIALGYPAEKPERFERIELNSLVHYEKYDGTKQLVS